MNPSLPSSMVDIVDKMKGDAIGDTLYSERWVLKTLMKLSEKYVEYTSSDDYHLEADLEGDLGLLWDMTVEPDVAKFLVENDVLDLIADIVKFSSSPRLTEIMIGILGNLACEESIRQKVGSNTELIKVIINLLNFTDSPTLVQLMRLMTTCIWDVRKRVERKAASTAAEQEESGSSHWVGCLKDESELVTKNMIFVLSSSRNEELLNATLGLMESLFNLTWNNDDYFCKQFSTEDCIKALMEAINEITSHFEDMTESFTNHRKLKEACSHWVTVLNRMTYHTAGRDALGKQADAVFDLVSTIWIEQSARGGSLSSDHISHLAAAVELLTSLLPSYSQQCQIKNALVLLMALTGEHSTWEEGGKQVDDREELRKALEGFCVCVVKQWNQKGVEVSSSLRDCTHQELHLLEEVLTKRVGALTSSTHTDDDFRLAELKRIIESLQIDL